MADKIASRLEDLPVIAAHLDAQGTITAVNAAWRRFGAANGYRPETCGPGSNYLDICECATGDRAEEAPAAAAGIRQVLDGRQDVFSLDYPCHSPTERRWFKLLVGRLQNEGGAVTLHVDITPEKLAELEVDQRRMEAERAVAARNRFLAAASHDLRQPLQAAELFIELLRKEVAGDKAGELVRHLSCSMDALRDILDSLSDISRLESGMQPLSIHCFALSDVLDQVAAEARALAEGKGLALRTVPTSAAVTTDPQLLGRILRNLLHNAITYTDRGRVLIGVRRRPGAVDIQILDTGIGIDPVHQQEVFAEFYQVGNQERDRRKGLGLGLSIVKRLAGLLALTVELRSRPGSGTMVSLRVPLAPPSTGQVQGVQNLRE